MFSGWEVEGGVIAIRHWGEDGYVLANRGLCFIGIHVFEEGENFMWWMTDREAGIFKTRIIGRCFRHSL